MIRIALILGIICNLFLIPTSESKAGTMADLGDMVIGPFGACCNVGVCTEDILQMTCEMEGGDFQGPATICSEVMCPIGPPSGPTVIVPTMGQWGMILAAIILGLFAVLKLRRRTES